MPMRLEFWRTLHSKRELRSVCCSGAWIDAILRPTGDGKTFDFLDELYPPGRDDTLMRECPECHRVCPPNLLNQALCCDCEATTGEMAFLAWVEAPSRRALRRELRRRYWVRRVTYGLSAVRLMDLASAPGQTPMGFALTARSLGAAATPPMQFDGPCREDEAALPHIGFWVP